MGTGKWIVMRLWDDVPAATRDEALQVTQGLPSTLLGAAPTRLVAEPSDVFSRDILEGDVLKALAPPKNKRFASSSWHIFLAAFMGVALLLIVLFSGLAVYQQAVVAICPLALLYLGYQTGKQAVGADNRQMRLLMGLEAENLRRFRDDARRRLDQ